MEGAVGLLSVSHASLSFHSDTPSLTVSPVYEFSSFGCANSLPLGLDQRLLVPLSTSNPLGRYLSIDNAES